jgi:hypothetical protein
MNGVFRKEDCPLMNEKQPPSWPWYCPLPIITVFWKIAFGVFGLLLAICVATLWLLTFYVSNLSHDFRLAKDEIVLSQSKTLELINGHKQLTMENRSITSEIRGVLNGWVIEGRKGFTDIEEKRQSDKRKGFTDIEEKRQSDKRK